MQITSLEINHLYGIYDGKVSFGAGVNILAGINGSFKSTILQLLYALTMQQHPSIELDRAVVNYDEGLRVYYYAKKAEDNGQGDSVVQQLTRYRISEYLTKEEFAQDVKLSMVKTFDIVSTGGGEKNQLDIQLAELLNGYTHYLQDLALQRDEILNTKGMITREEVDQIEADKRELLTHINRFFAASHKQLDPLRSDFRFTTEEGQQIQINQLSSGEKQLLILLLTVFLQRRQACVVLMDEPELSLHIDWQYQLLDVLTTLNPQAQFIITTHSPSIFGNRWGEKVIYIEDLIVRS